MDLSHRRFDNIGMGVQDVGRQPFALPKEISDTQTALGKFKPPGLRNVAITAPYMHDGSIASLEEVIRFYMRGGDFDENKLIQMIRQFGEINAHSEDDWKKLILDFSAKLPVIQGYSSALTNAELSKYKIESEFFGSIRNNSAEQINNRFKQGFFSWLL